MRSIEVSKHTYCKFMKVIFEKIEHLIYNNEEKMMEMVQ